MNSELKLLFREYDEVLNSQVFNEKDLNYSILEKHITLLNKLNIVEQSSISIFDLYKKKHLYLSSGFESVLGFDIVKAEEEGNEYFNSRVHPDDFIKSLQVGSYFMHFGINLPQNEKKNFKLINEYRIRARDNKYIRVIEQFQALELDRQGNAWLALCILDISPDQDISKPMKSKMLNFKTGELYSFPPDLSKIKLANREHQILGMISDGMISKEIADKLFISVHTVNTHRQRIIEKMEAKNIYEAIKLARDYGLFN